MALGSCPECGGQVSSAAEACPHCGHPLPQRDQPGGRAPRGEEVARRAVAPGGLAATPGVPANTESTSAERVVWEGRPSLKLLTVDAVTTFTFAIFLIVATIFTLPGALRAVSALSKDFARAVSEQEGTLRTIIWVVVAAAIVFRLARLATRALTLRQQSFRLTSQRLTLESGLFSRRLVELDMRAIEDVSLSQTVTERLLGLGTIELAGAEGDLAVTGISGSSRGRRRLSLVGVRSPRDVRETIRDVAYQATRNQLFTRAT